MVRYWIVKAARQRIDQIGTKASSNVRKTVTDERSVNSPKKSFTNTWNATIVVALPGKATGKASGGFSIDSATRRTAKEGRRADGRSSGTVREITREISRRISRSEKFSRGSISGYVA